MQKPVDRADALVSFTEKAPGFSGDYLILHRHLLWSVLIGHEIRQAACVVMHTHAHGWEARFIVKGKRRLRIGRRWYRAQAGDVLLTRWWEPHGTRDTPDQRNECYVVKFHALTATTTFLGLPPAFAERLRGAIDRLPHVFRGSAMVRTIFRQMMACGQRAHANPLTETRCYILLLSLLNELVACCRTRRSAGAAEVLRQRVEAYLRDHPGRPSGVDQIAADMGLSASAFSKRFLRLTGMSPHAFMTQCRMHLADCLLREGDLPVVEIAARLGFGSPQHFSNAFRHQMGISPRRWRDAVAARRRPPRP